MFLATPGTNVVSPRTAFPALMGEIRSGETWLACAVLGTVMTDAPAMPFAWRPTFKGYRVEAPDFALDLLR